MDSVQIPSVEEAREELAQIQAFLGDFEQRASQVGPLRERAAFLNGLLVGGEAPPAEVTPLNREERRAAPKAKRK